jgi:glyoxylase-like metal-dependent hydrolase (beta-lactamase superfamily II)
MPKSTKNLIHSVRYYNCGHCVNRLGFAYRGHSFKKRIFPAGVFLIEHATKGYVLFDTGYSTDIYTRGIRGWIYRTLNPTYVRKDEEIAKQLKRDGVSTSDIAYVIVSHLHPDHVGGLKSFPKSKIILSANTHRTQAKPSFSDLIFKTLLPNKFESQIVELEAMGLKQRTVRSLRGYDLFGDGSILIAHLEGHTHGHLGTLVADKLLLAGDACWGGDLLDASRNMRSIVKLIHHNHASYIDSLDLLQSLRKKGVRLCFSHDIYSSKELLDVE